MAYQDIDLLFTTPEDGDVTVTFQAKVARAEPDVGIMSDYVDDFSITAVDGEPVTEGEIDLMTSWLEDEYGQDGLVEKLNELI